MRTLTAGFAMVLTATLTLVANQLPPPPPPVPPGQPTPGPPVPGQRTPVRSPVRSGEDPIKGTATIRGYVTAADTGTPIRRAQVRAMSQEGRGGGVTTTDAQGRFELKDLPASRYTLTATKGGFVTMQYGQRRPGQPGTPLEIADNQLVEKVAFALPRGGVIHGRIVDEFGEPVPGAQVTVLQLRYMNGARRLTPAGAESGNDRTDDQGAFRLYGLAPGDYFVSATLRTQQMMMMPGVTSTEQEGYAPTYYPGTPSAAEAQRVAVKVGAETNATFALAAARLAKVSGRVISTAGEPLATGMVMAQPADSDMQFGFMMMSSPSMVNNGRFEVAGLAPGTYVLTVRPRGMPNENQEYGQTRVTVDSGDIDNVTIVTSRGARAHGFITTDEGTPLPVRPQQVQLFASPLDPMGPSMMGGEPPRINDDWTFELSGLFERRVIRASLMSNPEWSVKAVLVGADDVTDSGIEFAPGRVVEGLQVVFTRKTTEVSGTVKDERGGPARDTSVVIFPADSSRWTPMSRYVRTAQPDQEGRYRLRNMPPFDDYLIVAVRDLEQGRWSDPEFLESMREAAVRLSLNEAETKVQDLSVSRAP